jgi:hypothetical protein
MPFKSKIERLFFQGVTFYQLKKNAQYKTHYQRIDDTDFLVLTTLFHPKIDFQMSALSTYKPSVTCHSFPVTSLFYLRNDQIMRKHKISSDKIIRFEDVCQPMRDHSFGNFEMVSKFLKKISHLSKYKRIVVSLCAGRAEMELLSEYLCICMDVDKQALFSSLFALRYMYWKKANIIYHRRDMSVGMRR